MLTAERLPILETVRAVESLQQAQIPVAAALVNRVIPDSADGHFLQQRRRQEASYLQRIDHDLGHLPRPLLPWLETDVQGIEVLQQLAQLLAEQGF